MKFFNGFALYLEKLFWQVIKIFMEQSYDDEVRLK